jgi:hypothetical protein
VLLPFIFSESIFDSHILLVLNFEYGREPFDPSPQIISISSLSQNNRALSLTPVIHHAVGSEKRSSINDKIPVLTYPGNYSNIPIFVFR